MIFDYPIIVPNYYGKYSDLTTRLVYDGVDIAIYLVEFKAFTNFHLVQKYTNRLREFGDITDRYCIERLRLAKTWTSDKTDQDFINNLCDLLFVEARNNKIKIQIARIENSDFKRDFATIVNAFTTLVIEFNLLSSLTYYKFNKEDVDYIVFLAKESIQ